MSKIGRYFESQIEAGNFTVDQRGTYRVKDRKKHAVTTGNATPNSISGHGTGKQRRHGVGKKH